MGQLCRVRTRLFGSRSSAKVGGSASDRIQMFGADGDPLGTAQNVSTYEFPGGVVCVEKHQNLCVCEVEEGGIPMLDVELSPIGA